MRSAMSRFARTWSGMFGSSIARSRYPRIDVSGVRSSCETEATRSSRARSALSSAVTSRETTTAPVSCPSGSVSRRAAMLSACRGPGSMPNHTICPSNASPRAPARPGARPSGSCVTPSSRTPGSLGRPQARWPAAAGRAPRCVTAILPSASTRTTPKSTASSTSVTTCSCSAGILQHPAQQLRLLGEEGALGVRPPGVEVARGGHRGEHERKQQRTYTSPAARSGPRAPRGSRRSPRSPRTGPSRPKPAASHVVGKIQSRPSAEPGAASCMSVMATMSIAGTTATQPGRRRFHGITNVAPVTTITSTTPPKSSGRSPLKGPVATSTPENEHDRGQQQLIEHRAAFARAVGEVLGKPGCAYARRAAGLDGLIVVGRSGHTATLTDVRPPCSPAGRPPTGLGTQKGRNPKVPALSTEWLSVRPSSGQAPARADQRPESFSRSAARASSSASVPPELLSEEKLDEPVSAGAFASASMALATAAL